MKLATAPVNWNNADVTDYRPWIPYPALLDEMVAAGYNATEWGMNMELGEGIARVPEVINSLRQAGYTGWVVIEQDTTPDDPTTVAEKNRCYLELLIK